MVNRIETPVTEDGGQPSEATEMQEQLNPVQHYSRGDLPHREVAGEFYDVIRLDGGRLGLMFHVQHGDESGADVAGE